MTARQVLSAQKTDMDALEKAANGEIPLGYGWSKVELDKLVSMFRKYAGKRKLSEANLVAKILQLLVNKRTEITLGILEHMSSSIVEVASITLR